MGYLDLDFFIDVDCGGWLLVLVVDYGLMVVVVVFGCWMVSLM